MTTLEIPLAKNEDGVWLVQGTRVPLDTIVTAYEMGATPEGIASSYPTVSIEDVYAVLGFYLKNREEVGKYLQERRERAALVREENERRFPPHGIRARLEARQASQP